MNPNNPPTLTDATGMGGLNAGGGFDYQYWYALTRIPEWLSTPSFDQLLLEGLEDIEARFFAPHARNGAFVDRFQAKSGHLAPASIREVVSTFLRYENAYPQTARVQTLVTPHLPATLAWLRSHLKRVRLARPFYAPFQDIIDASAAKLEADLVDEFGQELGVFAAEHVDFEEALIPSEKAARIAFSFGLEAAFPSLSIDARTSNAAFDALDTLLRRSVGAPLSREAILKCVQDGSGLCLLDSRRFPLLVRSDRTGSDERALEIDASTFSSGLRDVEPQRWGAELLEPLERVSSWLGKRAVRRVAVSGTYRLTTGMAVGWSLRSTKGFELEIHTKSDNWSTDSHATQFEDTPWLVELAQELEGDCLIVSVGILRDPAAALQSNGVSKSRIVRIYLSAPLTSGTAVQEGVFIVKRAVDQCIAALKPKRVALYLAGPAAFAVALGHRWNALPSTLMFEFDSASQEYFPAATLT